MSVEVTLSAAVRDQELLVSLRFENVSDEPRLLSRANACLAGYVDNSVFEVTCDGEQVPYVGPRVFRPEPTAADFSVLGPGESCGVDLNLGEVHPLPSGCASGTVKYGAVHGWASQGGIFSVRSGEIAFRRD